MPTFELSGPDGATYHLDAPDEGSALQAFHSFNGSAPAAPSKSAFGYVDDAVRSLANGATFGFADELAAKGNAAFGSGTYDQNIKQERARDAQIPSAIAIPGQIAGGVASTIAAAPIAAAMAPARFAAAANALPSALKFGAIGAGEGALAGAGNAEEGGRLQGALTGAAIGAPLGAASPYIASGASKIYSGIKNAVSDDANVAADLGRALTRDNMTPEQLASQAQQLQTLRPGVATLADAGGENVKGLVERVAQTPGAGRTQVVPALTGRQQGQAMRLASDLRDLTGTAKTAQEAVTDTMAQRAGDARPLYNQAYQAGDRAIWSPELEQLSSSPTVQDAMRGAVKAWRDNAVADGYGAMNPGAMVKNGGNLKLQGGQVPAFPNLQFWDYTKRILDDQASAAVRAGEGQRVKTLSSLARSLRGALDTEVPEFAAARNAWAGPSRYLDAFVECSGILSPKIGSEEQAARLAAMTDSEREAYRTGAISSVIGKMGNDPAKLGDMTKYLRSPEMRAKITAIMPTPEAAQKWADRLNFEVGSSELAGRALGNSATARRQAERQDSENLVGDLVMHAISGGTVPSLLRSALTSGPKWLRDTMRSRADGKLADVLTNPARNNAADLSSVLGRIKPPQGGAGGSLPASMLTAGFAQMAPKSGR